MHTPTTCAYTTVVQYTSSNLENVHGTAPNQANMYNRLCRSAAVCLAQTKQPERVETGAVEIEINSNEQTDCCPVHWFIFVCMLSVMSFHIGRSSSVPVRGAGHLIYWTSSDVKLSVCWCQTSQAYIIIIPTRNHFILLLL